MKFWWLLHSRPHQCFSKAPQINDISHTLLVYQLTRCRKYLGPDSIYRWHLTSIGNPIVNIRRSYDRLISTMRFPILVRWHHYIESEPWWGHAGHVEYSCVMIDRCLGSFTANELWKEFLSRYLVSVVLMDKLAGLEQCCVNAFWRSLQVALLESVFPRDLSRAGRCLLVSCTAHGFLPNSPSLVCPTTTLHGAGQWQGQELSAGLGRNISLVLWALVLCGQWW